MMVHVLVVSTSPKIASIMHEAEQYVRFSFMNRVFPTYIVTDLIVTFRLYRVLPNIICINIYQILTFKNLNFYFLLKFCLNFN